MTATKPILVSSYSQLPSVQLAQKEKREFLQRQAALEAYQDLRDDLMSLVRNSGMSFEEIHGHCGPTPETLVRWADHKVIQPRLGKMRATARILGYDIGIIKK